MKKIKRFGRKFCKMLRRTWKQKLLGLFAILIGWLTFLPEHDATVFILSIVIGLYLIVCPERVFRD